MCDGWNPEYLRTKKDGLYKTVVSSYILWYQSGTAGVRHHRIVSKLYDSLGCGFGVRNFSIAAFVSSRLRT